MNFEKLTKGVTLSELMIVIAIIGILAAIGFPSYQTYLTESRRSDAINTMRANQQLIEDYMYLNGTTPGSGDLSFITNSPSGFYTVAYTQISSTTYQLVATAVSGTSQANDTGCTVITLSSVMDNVWPTNCK
jgi:type IV pilus assembly protein PilE